MPRHEPGRAGYADIVAYRGSPPSPLDLSDNTNLWGTSPAVQGALRAAAERSVSRYPSAYSLRLNEAIARYAEVEPDMVLTGNGSDNLLDCAFRALAEPGERVAYADPTFVMGPTFARTNSLVPVGIPWCSASEDDLELDADAILETKARIIYLCSPNNPTGTTISPIAMERVVREAPGVVIVDEAYFEFADWTAATLIPECPNLIVIRTLSKAFGLAGLRVGYALGDSRLLAEVAKARGPFAVSSVAEEAACAALTDGLSWMNEHVALARQSREKLRECLREAGACNVLESAANFLLVRPADPRMPSVTEIDDQFRARGIAVRKFTRLTGIGDALRITVAPWPMMELLLNSIPLPARGSVR